MNTDQGPSIGVRDNAGTKEVAALGTPDRRIDAEVHRRYRAFTVELRSGPISDGLPVPHYTTSLDAVIDLIHEFLPGWSYSVSTGSLADDVRLVPGQQEHEAPDSCSMALGLEASFAPAPRAALSLLAIFIETKAALKEQRPPQAEVPAARELFATATAVREAQKRKLAETVGG